MAVGTTVKVGFDGTAVQKGFGKISGMFKNIGRGMAMGAGAIASKSLIDLALKALTGVDALADFAGEAEDVALQTRSTTSEIILLNEALKRAGANVDAGRMLSVLNDNIFDAANSSEELQKAFSTLGLQSSDFVGKSTIESFQMIGRAVRDMGSSAAEAENALEAILGGKMSMQMLRLFRNSTIFDQVDEEVGTFAKNVEEQAVALGAAQDQFRRITYLWKGINLAIFKNFGDITGIKTVMDALQKGVDTGDFRPIKEELAKALEVIGDLLESKLREAGEAIGEGISNALRNAFSEVPLLQKLFTSNTNSPSSAIDPTKEIMRTNQILERIYRDGGAMYA